MSDKQHQHERKRANPDAPVKNHVTYVAKPGKEAELLALVKKHEPALRKVGLVTNEPFKLWKAYNIRTGEHSIVEHFVWKDGKASDVAHQTPEVMAVWEPMGPVLADLRICEVESL
jgi:hypothetical protein